MAQFGNADGSLVPGAAYMTSFGNLPDRTVYRHHPVKREAKSIDISGKWEGKELKLEVKSFVKSTEAKALQTTSQVYATGTSYTTTSGSLPTLLPIYLDPEITDITNFDTPLYSGIIKRRTNRGAFTDFNKLTAKGTIQGFTAEDGALTEADDTYTRVTKPIKFCYAVGRVTGPMLAASAEYLNAMQQEISVKRRSLVEHLEKQICTGTTNDATGFDGFTNWVTTNTSDGSSTAVITIDLLRTAVRTIRNAYGHPDLIVTDYKTLDDIKALIQSHLRYVSITQISFGITAVEVDGIPIIADLAMPTSSGGKEIHVYDTNTWELRVLQDETMEELAKTNDSSKFMIKWYGSLVCKAENWNYRFYSYL